MDFYHNIFFFYTTDLQSDAIFVFAAGQKNDIGETYLCYVTLFITLIKAQVCDTCKYIDDRRNNNSFIFCFRTNVFTIFSSSGAYYIRVVSQEWFLLTYLQQID